MLGKQIAENLRQNRERWTKYRYFEDGKYCVIGLKLHEMGVKVEEWPLLDDTSPTTIRQGNIVGLLVDTSEFDPHANLSWLQRANDNSRSVDDLIAWADMHSTTEFPLEALAEALKQSS